MSAERDAGLQALQQGNSGAAIPLLETACQQNPGDFDAHLFLGAAYGQVGKQMEAIHVITHAVQLQPANAQARYNLAVAMEQGGYREQAVTALEQALQLQPDYPKAQDALRRLQASDSYATAAPGATGSTPSGVLAELVTDTGAIIQSAGAPATASSTATPSYGDPVPGAEAPLPQFGFGQVADAAGAPVISLPPAHGTQVFTPGAYSASPPTGAGEPLYGAPPSANAGVPPDQPPNAYASPPPYGSPAPGGYTAPPPSPYGASAPGPYGAPGASPYTHPAPSPYGAAQSPAPYSVPGSYGQASPYSERRRRSENYEDSFNIIEAAKSWGSMIVRPAPFLREMAGSQGMLAPLALALLYVVPIVLGIALQYARAGAQFSRAMSGLGPVFAGGGVVVMLLIGLPLALLGMFLMAWVLHLIGRAFGNSSPYSSSFRALVYSYAPVPLLQLIGALIPTGDITQLNPAPILLGLVGFLWGTVLLIMAISTQQEIDTGPAVGVVLLSYVALAMLYGVIIFVVFMLLIFVGLAAAGSHSIIPLR